MTTEVDVPVSEVAPDYSLKEVRGNLAEAHNVVVPLVDHPEVSLCYFIQKNSKQLFFNVLSWVMLGVVLIVFFLGQNNLPLYSLGGLSVLVLYPYLYYLAESLEVTDFDKKSWTFENEAQDILAASVNKQPQIKQIITCYHKEGESEIETFRFTKFKQFIDWYDASPRQVIKLNRSEVENTGENAVLIRDLPLKRHNYVKRIYVKFYDECANKDTTDDFERQLETMIEEYRNKDDKYRYEEYYDIPGVPRQILVSGSQHRQKSIWFDYKTYLICVFLGCAFPFRCILEMCCVKSQVWSNKKVLATTDLSADAIRNNQYSVQEAMLVSANSMLNPNPDQVARQDTSDDIV